MLVSMQDAKNTDGGIVSSEIDAAISVGQGSKAGPQVIAGNAGKPAIGNRFDFADEVVKETVGRVEIVQANIDEDVEEILIRKRRIGQRLSANIFLPRSLIDSASSWAVVKVRNSPRAN